MKPPDIKEAISFVTSFADLYMFVAGLAIAFLIFVAIVEIGFKQKKAVKVFTTLFVRVFSLWVISSCLIVIVAGNLMTSAWDGVLLVIDLLSDRVSDVLKGAL